MLVTVCHCICQGYSNFLLCRNKSLLVARGRSKKWECRPHFW